MNDGIPMCVRGAALVVVRRTGADAEFLLLRRKNPPVGAWSFIGGKIESNEKAYEAALREAREEAGVEVQSLYSADLFDQVYVIDSNSIWVASFLVGFVDPESRVTRSEEHDDHRWCKIDEALDLLTFPTSRRILRNICEDFVRNEPVEHLKIEIT